jgi:flagellar protein FliO/FliZ
MRIERGIGLRKPSGAAWRIRWSALICAVLPLALPAAERGAVPASVGASNLLQLIFGLIVVIAAILATGFLLRRVGRLSSSMPGALRVVAGLNVGARERVIVVQVGEQQLLLGVAPGRVQTLHVLPQPLAPSAGTAAVGMDQFAERLSRLMKRGQQR